ncbi:MAG: hypothetical protein LIO52_03805 [Oscillospiraceae bacterium]|nr:hypothetical protein [Oscillospiraceae bacterium]
MQETKKARRSVVEPVICLTVLFILFGLLAWHMGLINMMNTMLNMAYSLLTDTVLYIMAIAVIMGALSGVLSEFGVVHVINQLLSPLMKPLYNMPGAAALGIVTTYLSDNPAILALADNSEFRSCFKPYQLPALTNIGTSFGMGLIITAYMISVSGYCGESLFSAVVIGNIGAIAGSIVSTRLMMLLSKGKINKDKSLVERTEPSDALPIENSEQDTLGLRILNSLIDGGKTGVKVGVDILAPVLIVCTFVMMLTNGSFENSNFTGAAYEGIGLVPMVLEKINFIFQPLFGFTSINDIAVPITALGSAGAAIALVPSLLQTGLATAHDVAVFTAMCMCWSGYLSTHVSMMKALNFTELTGSAIISHTIGGIAASVAANWIFKIFVLWG